MRHGAPRRAPDVHPRPRSDEGDQGTEQRPARHHALHQQRARPGHGDDVADDRRRARNVFLADRPAGAEKPGLRHLRRRLRLSRITTTSGRRWMAISAIICASVCRTRSASSVVHNCYDHGFREITTRTKPIETPDDLKGFKIRLPVAPYLIALFQHLGASPTPINFGEVYSALQTGRGRRPGKPAGADRHRQALRGAEILQPDQPRLGRHPLSRSATRRGSGCRPICRSSPTRSSTPRRCWNAPTGRS